MAFTHYVTRSYQDRGETVSNKETLTGNEEAIFDQSVPAGTDTHYVFNLKRSPLVSMSLWSDIGCTVCTNGAGFSSPPADTDKIVLAAGETIVWTLGQDTLSAGVGLVDCPISADITTGIYVTNSNAASPPLSARLKIKALLSV